MVKQKQSCFDVDQSVRVEELNRDTIIGIGSKSKQYSFRLSRKTKRFFNEYFRKLGQPRYCAPVVFAAAVILSLRKTKASITTVIIDTEYTGYETLIQIAISNAFPRAMVEIRRIGKLSPAHQAAYGTHIGKKKDVDLISRSEMQSMITRIRRQKDGWRVASPGMNRGSQTQNQPVNKKYTKKRRKSKRKPFSAPSRTT